MKTVLKKKKKKIQLKLWLFQVAKCYGSQFEKKNVPERFFLILHIFLSNRGLQFAKLSEFVHSNESDNSV